MKTLIFFGQITKKQPLKLKRDIIVSFFMPIKLITKLLSKKTTQAAKWAAFFRAIDLKKPHPNPLLTGEGIQADFLLMKGVRYGC